MAGRSGQFGEPTPFGNEKGAADRTRGHEGPDSDEQPRFCPIQMLTRHQDDAGDGQDNSSRSEEGLSDCFGVDGESIGYRIRGEERMWPAMTWRAKAAPIHEERR